MSTNTVKKIKNNNPTVCLKISRPLMSFRASPLLSWRLTRLCDSGAMSVRPNSTHVQREIIYPHRSLRFVVCPFVPLLSFFGPLYYLSFFDLRIAITLWYISPVTYVYYMIKDAHIYVKNWFVSTHMLLKSPVVAVI
jgi:hypothetical protein